jgi:ArsR family transcriptional regulator
MATTTLTPEQFQRITRALGDPTRYEMLRRIYASAECLTCGGAVEELPITAGTGSHHLRELEIADLITVTRDGRHKRLTPRRSVWRAYLAELRRL